MPVDLSHSRRTSRLVNDDDVGLRRARGELSCAECRRLKLKCDKKIPCSSCTRRGCAPICPNGSLATGQGARSHLADTAQLQAKIVEMRHRIRQLEEEVALFQSSVSEQPHPLLREDLLTIKDGFGKPVSTNVKELSSAPLEREVDTTTTAFGTLTIGEQGEGKYFGPSAGAEALFLAGADLDTQETGEEDLPAEISVRIAEILATEGNTDKAMDLLFDHLPDQPRASSLIEAYLEHAAWSSNPVRRDEIVEDIFSPTYKALKARHAPDMPVANFSPHKLAVLYMVLALGALVDLTLEPCSKEAEHYYHLTRACVSLRSTFDSPEIYTVQALLLMGIYHGWAGNRYTVDSSWGLISLAAKLAQSMGLHRDPSRWNIDEKMAERRRLLFWEVFSAEQLYSLALGRPPSIRPSYLDSKFPADEVEGKEGETNPLLGYLEWKYSFMRDVLSITLEETVAAKPPKYETILDLDRRLREKKLPSHLNVFTGPEEPSTNPSIYMRQSLLGQYRSLALLYIHRNYFAQAIQQYPENPLRSPYAPSFLATYRCASGIIKSCMNYYKKFPQLSGRWWGIWTHLFSAAVIVGCIVTRAPASSMASSAYFELGLACDLYEKGVIQSRRSRSGLATLYKIRTKASEIYSQCAAGSTGPTGGILSTGKPDYGEDELALFGGQTKVLVSKLLSQYNRTKSHAPSSNSSQTTGSSNGSQGSDSDHGSPNYVAEVHPRLVEYLSMFPPSTHSSPTPSVVQDMQAEYPVLSGKTPTSASNGFDSACRYQSQSQAQSSMSWWPQSQPPVSGMNQDNGGYGQIPNMSRAGPQTHGSMPGFGFDSRGVQGQDSAVDLGIGYMGQSAMDEQWVSFIRDSGFFESSDTPPNTQTRLPGPSSWGIL
ncbi:hypothetical protein FA15DRAFT_664908 [Coprinopsis marcescibilis]|uniref:Zn(2)-C6 fungal-type domain-containing protein n=1 Tax=Coprinopsis marcescibilis TaxID=230819 RepID=A0A5C3LJN7_COPMA|nr:hypothetical protein FA15DRAFT_664908 [Coprinopsis marcescibilis]